MVSVATDWAGLFLRAALVIVGAWGFTTSTYIGVLYWRARYDLAHRLHFRHVVVAAVGYCLLTLAVLLRAVFVPAPFTWVLVFSLPGYVLLNVGMSLLLRTGHLPRYNHPRGG